MLPFLLIKNEKAIKMLTLLNPISDEAQIEEAFSFFGNKVYTDNPNRYTLTCIICGSKYERRKTRWKTCSRKCGVIFREGRKHGEYLDVTQTDNVQ